ncbi:titin isoform X2 [Brachypodium distachyon]|uniref:Dynein light chain n=1 Tax=Brachypodium distachyon TaxID=15368 RepID=A0A0Q3FPJ0_BRADI|nr:titin isoform X2 [Brachypodium distachyon]KQK00045.1 hypothetical protein BRADI_3g46970v3 [Brachypodium distachyon]PNT68917.1 hypothetical protein BRADI_3g46970v3 [Brachypodium distachyon]|eukprot:XP_010235598.1 titin isoform X2 [Brachypodium distachyon]
MLARPAVEAGELPPSSAAMDPASEELERRSRYLSSLIRRTKLNAAPAPPPPTPSPDPDLKLKLELELERERSVIRRTKLDVAPAPPPPTPPPEPETKLELELVPEPEPRSRSLVVAKAVVEKREVKDGDGKGKDKGKEEKKVSVRVRATDMPLPLQRRAIRLAHDAVAATPRVDGKRLALALKKNFIKLFFFHKHFPKWPWNYSSRHLIQSIREHVINLDCFILIIYNIS